jgi:hypothetical protein
MVDDEQPKVPGRPRRHASDQARGAADQRRAAGAGLVRVSVIVPPSRRPDIIAIAAAMRTLRRASVERRPDAGPYTMAGKPWRPADDTLLRSPGAMVGRWPSWHRCCAPWIRSSLVW